MGLSIVGVSQRTKSLSKFITLGQGGADGDSKNICILAPINIISTLVNT